MYTYKTDKILASWVWTGVLPPTSIGQDFIQITKLPPLSPFMMNSCVEMKQRTVNWERISETGGRLQIRGVRLDTVVTEYLFSRFGSLIGLLGKTFTICLKPASHPAVFLFLSWTITISIGPSQVTDCLYISSVTSNQYVVKHYTFQISYFIRPAAIQEKKKKRRNIHIRSHCIFVIYNLNCS